VPLVEVTVDRNLEQVLGWADDVRRLGVRANADTPEDAARARTLGAGGIGLCRTEHMFMAADRQPKMRAMIMPARTTRRERARRACRSERLQGCSSRWPASRSIRLLDPPLHEFLPTPPRWEVERRGRTADGTSGARGRRLARVEESARPNPMLGTPRDAAGDRAREIYEMQVGPSSRTDPAAREAPHPRS
jgi:pyruvate,orthophosphate dikinase